MDLNQAADRVGAKLVVIKPTLTLDPVIIQIIIDAIKELLPLFIEVCQKTSAEAAATAQSILEPKGLVEKLTRWRTAVYVARRIGVKRYRQAGDDDLLNACMQAAIDATPAEIEALYLSLPKQTEPLTAKITDFIPAQKS